MNSREVYKKLDHLIKLLNKYFTTLRKNDISFINVMNNKVYDQLMDIREISDHFDLLSPLSASTATNQLKKVSFTSMLSPSRRFSKDKLEKSLIL